MPEKLTTSILRSMVDRRMVATSMELIMARELLALRAHGEAAPVAWRVVCANDECKWHGLEYPAFSDRKRVEDIAEKGGWADRQGCGPHRIEPLYAAPPPEAGGEGIVRLAMDVAIAFCRNGTDEGHDRVCKAGDLCRACEFAKRIDALAPPPEAPGVRDVVAFIREREAIYKRRVQDENADRAASKIATAKWVECREILAALAQRGGEGRDETV